MSVPADRADGVAAVLAERDLDALVVTDLVGVRWLTGFTGSNGVAVVGRGDAAGGAARAFLTDFRYVSQAAVQVGEPWRSSDAGRDLLGSALRDALPADGRRVGFDDEHVSVAGLGRLESALAEDGRRTLVGAGGIVEGLRETKDEREIEAVAAASQLADAALEQLLDGGLVGRTEREVALELETAMRRAGASAPSFSSIVASGAHGALPHAVPRDVAIERGSLVTIDWGAELDGYCSDCTRTVAAGPVGDEQRAVFDLVLRSQVASLAAVGPGTDARAVDAIARDLIAEGGHAEHFGHGLGHGVGLEVHERPTLNTRTTDVLRPGHVVTVEPGVYVPGSCGVRIEDLVVVTADGQRVLSAGLPKELVDVG